MADSKISALPASTTPLAGTEVLPIVQSSTTRQVSVANLTAGRAISATQLTLTTGNLIVASGQGIDFSATAGTGTSELFNDYEEGTWTPVLTPNTSGTITITSPANSLNYTKTGRVVTLTGRITITSVSLPLGLLILTGFPFTSGATASKNSGAGAIYPDNMTTALALSFRIAENSTGGIIATPNQGDAAPIMQANTNLYINIAYTV
jgi:hypothetical protein